MHHRSHSVRPFGALVRIPASVVLVATTGVAVAACGSGSPSSTASAHHAATGSCASVAGAHHARLVVEATARKVVQRCVGFPGRTIPAVKLLTDSHIEIGTQKFSFGLAICQVDRVPAHYSQCLPSGQDYWAVFLSADGHHWTSPSTGVSDIKVPAGGSLGLRYDSPKGKPAPPPSPSPA